MPTSADELRKGFARTADDAKRLGYKARRFLQHKRSCAAVCDSTGVIGLDVQFLPDVEIPCTECRGSRATAAAGRGRRGIRHETSAAAATLCQAMDMNINTALKACTSLKQATTLAMVRALGDPRNPLATNSVAHARTLAQGLHRVFFARRAAAADRT